ncbi:MAG: hypothetical protein A2Z88_07435 [Omnitrophica WOR_2 bacterium GWA2_47_8]|nr:MAG: hypothetical protein A2Z88_07435 [Omnitrophica WOR_2 bacterium GWA2_47_8]
MRSIQVTIGQNRKERPVAILADQNPYIKKKGGWRNPPDGTRGLLWQTQLWAFRSTARETRKKKPAKMQSKVKGMGEGSSSRPAVPKSCIILKSRRGDDGKAMHMLRNHDAQKR